MRWLSLLLVMGCEDTLVEIGGAARGEDSGQVDPAVSPVINACDAWCYLHTVGDVYYQWVIACDAEDPQGWEDLDEGEARLAGQAASFLVVCGEEGVCHTSFQEGADGPWCERAEEYSFEVQIQDQAGHPSSAYTVRGRQGTAGG